MLWLDVVGWYCFCGFGDNFWSMWGDYNGNLLLNENVLSVIIDMFSLEC